MLDKLFVPYKQALKLKELGFDEECIAFYCNVYKDTKFNYPYKGCVNSSLQEFEVTAPLYQQAFDWFREKYNLWVEIKVEDMVKLGNHRFYFSIFGIRSGFNNNTYISCINNSNESYYKSYEEAQLACLNKLIEICTK